VISQCSEPKLKKKKDVFLSLAFGFNVPEKMYFQCIKIWPVITRFFSNLIEHKHTWLLSISFLSYGNLLRVHIRFEFLMGIQTTYNDNFMIVKFWSLLKHIDTKVHVCKVQVSVPNLEFKYWRVSTRFVIHWAVADISGLLKRSSIYLHVFENYFSFSTCLQKVNIYLGNQGKVGTYKMVGSFFEAQLMGKINLL
jgi:hypothetical protein